MSSRGFTLIEVMLAVAIMAVAVVTLLLIQTEAIRMGGEADQLRLLSQLAQDKLHQLVLSQEESASGGFSDLHAGYTFSFVSAEERWKTPSSEEAGTDVEMVKEIQMRKSTLTVSSPDGTTRLEIVSYSFPHEPGEGGEGEGGEGEGGEE